MEEDIKKIYEYYFTYDKPIPYTLTNANQKVINLEKKISDISSQSEENNKLIESYKKELDNQTLLIHPVLISDYFLFYQSVGILTIEKNKISDPKIISMSYLDYIFHLIQNDEHGKEYLYMFYKILMICLKLDYDDIKIYKTKDKKLKLYIKGIEVKKKDFDQIRRIVCYQNMPSYDDTYIDPELEQALKEADELRNKENQGTTTLERQMIIVSKEYGYKLNELYDITIRKFVKMLEVADSILHYKVYRTGECSGMVSFKEPLAHYMYEKDKRFDSLINYDSFKDKFKQVT